MAASQCVCALSRERERETQRKNCCKERKEQTERRTWEGDETFLVPLGCEGPLLKRRKREQELMHCGRAREEEGQMVQASRSCALVLAEGEL